MSNDNKTNANSGSSNNESEKSNLGGSTSGDLSSHFRSTDATSSYPGGILPEAKGGGVTGTTVTSGNAGTQGQTGTATKKTTPGQGGEGIPDQYKK